MSKYARLILPLLLLSCFSSLAIAMRCQQTLVYEGDTKYQLLQKCGEPLSKDVYNNPETLYNENGGAYATVYNNYEIWTYQSAPNQFIYQVYIQDGVVKSISANRQ